MLSSHIFVAMRDMIINGVSLNCKTKHAMSFTFARHLFEGGEGFLEVQVWSRVTYALPHIYFAAIWTPSVAQDSSGCLL